MIKLANNYDLLSVFLVVGTVEEALNLGPVTFEERYGVSKPSQDSDILFHCRAGVRSLDAIEIANKLGYSK